MSLLSGINHVAVLTSNLQRWLEFYESNFGAEKIFSESTEQLRHAMVRVGEVGVLHAVEAPASPYAAGDPRMLARGHLDHIGLNVRSREAFDELLRRLVNQEASDGQVTDLGPQLSFWYRDPDGMLGEVCWIRDPALCGFHAPVAVTAEG